MDILSDVLATLKLSGSLYFHTEFSAPYAVRVPQDRETVRFHLVVSGSCLVSVPGVAQPTALASGDVIVIPHGAEQILADAPKRAPIDLADAMRRAGFDGKGALRLGGGRAGIALAPSRLICGFCRFDRGARHALLASLPRQIVMRGQDALAYPWLAEAIRAITYEALSDQEGRQAMSDRLSEILFIQAVRVHARNADHGAGFFAGLADPVLGRALSAMHEAPERDWTVESLARQAGASRSRFAQIFRDRVGLAPLAYLTDWRLQKARRLLVDTGLSVDEVAARVGYRSLPSFSRLFKRRYGVGPGGWRRSAIAEAA